MTHQARMVSPFNQLLAAQAINTHLYSVHGFRGNEQDYYNTDNSCLNKASLR
jgi:regulator of sirC expression with transglutaminase-like and TPR domain